MPSTRFIVGIWVIVSLPLEDLQSSVQRENNEPKIKPFQIKTCAQEENSVCRVMILMWQKLIQGPTKQLVSSVAKDMWEMTVRVFEPTLWPSKKKKKKNKCYTNLELETLLFNHMN